MTSKLRSLLLPGMIGASLALLLGFFGDFHPAFDSFAHFRVHLAFLTVVLAIALLFTPNRLLSLSALVFALSALSSVTGVMHLPFAINAKAFPARPGDRAVYRLLELNLRHDNATPEKVLSLIGRVQPDVLSLSEVSPSWKEKLKLLDGAYPYSSFCTYADTRYGVAVLSRRPFVEGGKPACHPLVSLTMASVDFSGSTVDIAALHLGWPWPLPQFRQISQMSGPLSTLADNAILAGDLNAAPWSAAASRLAAAGGLNLVASPGPTWIDRRLPMAFLFAGLPIDNVFVRGNVVVHSIERLEAVGSDHVPILVEFSVQPESEKPDGEQESATVSLERRRG